MDLSDVRWLFAYDRWATRRLLAVLEGVDEATWGATGVVGDRGLGAILVHMLGAHQRWRIGLGGSDDLPSPEREPLPSAGELAARWPPEWAALDAWLATLDDDWLRAVEEGVTHWQMLAHVVNHGTQHRSEAAALLTEVGRSPGELDMIEYAESLVAGGGPSGAP